MPLDTHRVATELGTTPQSASMDMFETRYDGKTYTVHVTGYFVHVFCGGKLYAEGEWRPGSYVSYSGDGPTSGYDWHLFDALDALLRTRDIIASPMPQAEQSTADRLERFCD